MAQSAPGVAGAAQLPGLVAPPLPGAPAAHAGLAVQPQLQQQPLQLAQPGQGAPGLQGLGPQQHEDDDLPELHALIGSPPGSPQQPSGKRARLDLAEQG